MSNARLETALIAACRKGDASAVARALSVIPSGQVDAVDVDGLSALVHATFCLRGSTGACGAAYERIARLLLKLGARVDLVDRNGSNALHHASFMGHTRMAAALCEHVVPSAIDTERANGESALGVAFEQSRHGSNTGNDLLVHEPRGRGRGMLGRLEADERLRGRALVLDPLDAAKGLARFLELLAVDTLPEAGDADDDTLRVVLRHGRGAFLCLFLPALAFAALPPALHALVRWRGGGVVG